MTEKDQQDQQDAREDAQVDQDTTEDQAAPEDDAQAPEDDGQGDTFPREYVEKLRKEAGDARTRAKRADDLAVALWAAQVSGTGRLADPTDLPMPEGVDPLDPDAAGTAVAELLAAKPHLAARVPRGFVGQGHTPTPPAPRSLGGLMRGRAG